MLFLTPLRHEVARAVLARTGRVLALDRLPVRARRSRWGHLRNGTGAIIEAGSRLAWRPPFVSIYYLTRASVHSELAYGLDELGRALRPPQSVRGRAVLATLGGVSALLVVASRANRRAPVEPPSEAPVDPEPAPAPVAA